MFSRSIPACAGETILCGNATGTSRVHPRVCGGNDNVPLKKIDGTGSIPACAGETVFNRLQWAG